MDYNVEITDEAIQDIIDIYRYIAINDSIENAEYVSSALEKAVESLSTSPNRGSYPSELLAAGVKDFREIYFKPYRIVYTVTEHCVSVILISDGRRNMQHILTKRVLGI